MGAADLVSAAVHASLVGEHLAEAPVLAVLFALASVVLVVLGVAALRRFASRWLVLWNGVCLPDWWVGISFHASLVFLSSVRVLSRLMSPA